ncbi:MAG: TIGR04282 family arsenosugar biosynthesis glycosyltransferase [Alphaproteobacteria bacterium]|uniref:TIGR04282 family arsenosugar biosynthesis glycosyltransferase n=1 Tax=Candidatus Nitrobium versatile TaxID=2884831 RepID=A0A953M0K1_9BACT|nr:TIGR04282 family arsenosugar biosynthesis glycosyltransferase [Candidatus Nitrobium versatile]
MRKPSALGIFFRIPEKGRVKKRLAAEIGEEAALRAYESMLAATIQKVGRLEDIDRIGFYAGRSARACTWAGIPFERQRGDDLGERMHNAFTLLFARGYRKSVLIGSDSPDLPLSFIIDAFGRLDSSDVVLGPSEDGGYYLIGIREPIPLDALFKGIPWGSRGVLTRTIALLRDAGKGFSLLPEWYDIDDSVGLKRWERSLSAQK